MKKNVSGQSTGAQLVSASDGTAFTGTATVVITEDNGTQTASGGTAPAHEGNGYHSYSPTQGETDADHIAFTWTGTGAIPVTIQVYTTFPQTVDNDVLASGATGFTAIDTVVDAIKVKTDFLPSATAGAAGGVFIAGTNAATVVTTSFTTTFTGNLTGSVASVTAIDTTAGAIDLVTANSDMRGTDSANTVVPPSVAQFNARTIISANYALEATLDGLITTVGVAGLGLSDLGGMSTAMKAEVNVEAKDVLFTDTITLIGQAAPSNTPTIAGAMGYIYKMGRNRTLQTATLWSMFADNGTTVDQTAVVSDDGTTAETAEVIAGT